MASKFEMISAIYNDHRNEIVSSPNSWTSFLSSACHNYRLPFDELVLIHAQRPDAIAVLEFDKWNKNFGRWVNAGAKGIAIFDKTPGQAQRLKHYFDISDTHETGFSRTVPIWAMKPEYDEDVIETLESTFGELKSKDTLIDAVLSAAEIATEDNISDYADVLIKFKQDSFLEELDDDSIRTIYRNTVTNSVAFVIASRLGIDADLYFDREDFEHIGDFNTDDAINAIGCATRDISEMALSEISKTVLSLEKENRTFAENDKSEYTEGVIKNERSLDYDKDYQLQKSRTGTDTKLGITISEESETRLVGGETQKVPEGEQKESLHNSADDLQAGSAPPRNSRESREDGSRPYEADVGTGGLDRATQGSGYDGLGTGYEQPENESSGNRSERSDLQLKEVDELPPFIDEEKIMAMLKNDDSLVHRKEFILQKHSELTSKQFARYVSTLYGGRLKSYNVDGIEIGYEYTTDGLLMYEGDYGNRTKESVFSWSVIGELISHLIENGEYLPPAKEEKTKPDTEQLQMGLFDLADYSFNNEVVEYEDSQTTLFPPVQIPQQIIDEAICLGTHDKESKMRISAYLRKDKPIDNNATFIKNEYKDFASGFVFEGQKISVLADDNGLRIDNGDTARFRSSTVLSWNDVAKRMRELLDLGRYMPQFQLDKVDEFERTKLAASLIYMKRDIDEPYKDTYMPFVMDLYNTHLGFPDVEKALAEELKKPESLSMVIDDLIVYIDALEKNNKINRFPRIYKPQDLLNKLCDLQLPQLEFQAQPGVPEVPSRFISEDEITWLLRSGSTESRLWHYSLYMTEPDANKRAKEIKDRHGWSGSYTSIADISSDAKGYTLSRGKIMEPYAKITLKWSDVEKRIGKMIALDIFLTDKDKAYMPIYEKEHIANTVSYFFNVANIDCQKSFDYSSHENIMQLLDNPEAVETIYNEMLDVLKDIKEDDRSYEGSHRAFEKFSQYREGTFSLFGEKKEPKPILAKEEIAKPDVSPTSSSVYNDYMRIEAENIGNLVFYQVGDFYEAMGDGAKVVASELDLVLTGRDVDRAARIAMCGFPVKSLDRYLKQLTSRGYKVTVSGLKDNGERVETTYTIDSDKIPVIQSDYIYKENESIPTKEEVIESTVSEKDKILPPPKAVPRGRVPTFDLHPEIPMSDRNNFRLADFEVETVGKKERFHRNMEAIRVLKECEFDNRYATPEEQKILAQYVGWGGIPEAFDEDNTAWADEYKELVVALSPDEYERARESTLTAFYTPPIVISAMYKALEQLGFKNGNILEPSCAIGNFIGMLPDSMSDSRIYGVELDNISAGIAKQLYQKSSIANMPFEEADIPDSFFDGVIGNVPFGDFKVVDKRYNKYNFLIHDYFFAKSLDKLRAGGVMLLITSKGTMDKENSNVRRYIAQRADLLGAIRLPYNTFKGNAGTEVTSDILILQKRDRMVDIEPSWVHLDTDENGVRMNKYFVDHPEMIMGDMVMQSGRFGMESACKPYENSSLADLLEDAVSSIHGEINEYVVDDELDESLEVIPADPNVRNFSFITADGNIYFRENSYMKPVDASATAKNRIKGMIGIRDCVRNLIDLQRENYPDEYIEAEQKKLNTLYDDFTKKYGLINSRANASAFSDDSSYFLLAALEVVEDGKLIRKADMFTKRTIKPHIPVTHADTASEALALSIGEKARVDIEYMQALTGKDEDTLFNDLQGVIFLNPLKDNPNEPKYLMADEYLSGNVREKLKEAKQMTEAYPKYQANVKALEKVQPKDLTASEIEVRLGATWLPTDIVMDFMFELLEPSYYNRFYIKVHFSEHTGEWNVEGKSVDKGNLKANNTYGTTRVNAYKIIENTLNLKDVKIFDTITDEEGKEKKVLNVKETQIAQSKQEFIKQAFKDWIWKDASRREKLCKMYNEKFNSIRPREYDGSHLIFHDMNSEITLRPHQLNAVAHEMYGGNTLLAHAVGAGKTMEMVAASHEGRVLGLWNKSMFVVPNHIIEQFASEYLQLYPSANILVATKKDFEKKNRKKFCAKIATGDYEAVIIGHSQFEKIPMSIERQRYVLEAEIDEITTGIAELKQSRGSKFSIKQLERSKKGITAKLKKLNNQERKDDVVTFEELGVDKLFVDEAHYFKNLFFYTKMNNVAGINNTEAQKSTDLYMKCRYLDEITGGKGVVFATGTPISNSMVELYTMQKYLQHSTLKKYHLEHFDAWASTFGETTTTLELKPEGTGYKARTRFAHFYNLPELMSMFKEIADIQTADMLSLPVPNAHFNNIAVKPSELQKEMVESLSERAEKVRSGAVEPTQDNMLKITNDGRKLALDQRMIDPLLPDNENSKVNACIDEVYRIWDEGKEDRLTQLIFCDLSTPKPLDENVLFTDVYNDIRNKLIAKGVPESEIAFIHNADSEAKKKDLFAKVRKGEVRVLLGSTQKMGAGTNVQDRLIAIHDIDCPWRPADLEQRAGRIIRQGNQNPDVYVNRYVTEGTFDAYLYQIIETKQKFISQIMTSKSPVRSAEDVDESSLSYAEIKMLATGNPHIKEKMDLDLKLSKLKMLKSNFLSERYALEDKVIKFYPAEIKRYEAKIKGLEADIVTANEHPKTVNDEFAGIVIFGKEYFDKKKAGLALINACKAVTSNDTIHLGEYRGFKLDLLYDSFGRQYKVNIKGAMTHTAELGTDELGNFTRMDNVIDGLEKAIVIAKDRLAETEKQFEIAKTDMKKEFPQDEELKKIEARLFELNSELKLDEKVNEVIADDVADDDEPEIKPKEQAR